MLMFIVFLLVLAAMWNIGRILRLFGDAFWLMLKALSSALRRARATGFKPWHHNHTIREQIASTKPPIDDFHRLSRQAMVYATRPDVTVLHHVSSWPHDPVLIRTTADPYGRCTYVERLQLIGGQVQHVVCLYLDRAEAPAEVGTTQFPSEKTCVNVLRARIEDIVQAGPFLSFRDPSGSIRETRLPKVKRHHA